MNTLLNVFRAHTPVIVYLLVISVWRLRIYVSSPCQLTQTVHKLCNTSSLTVTDCVQTTTTVQHCFDCCAEILILVAICVRIENEQKYCISMYNQRQTRSLTIAETRKSSTPGRRTVGYSLGQVVRTVTPMCLCYQSLVQAKLW